MLQTTLSHYHRYSSMLLHWAGLSSLKMTIMRKKTEIALLFWSSSIYAVCLQPCPIVCILLSSKCLLFNTCTSLVHTLLSFYKEFTSRDNIQHCSTIVWGLTYSVTQDYGNTLQLIVCQGEKLCGNFLWEIENAIWESEDFYGILHFP